LRVVTAKGPVTGIEKQGVVEFLGIPFAKPPLGEQRFKPPIEADPWDYEFIADRMAPAPLQNKHPMSNIESSEDSLYLNIWLRQNQNLKKPVIVWIFGGGFEGGAASDDSNGRHFAEKADVVFITFNYRVGLLGFGLVSPLDGAAPVSNIGVRDCIAALRWIQSNIVQFGGDPANITVMGASAGAFIACSLVAAPSAQGLFTKLVLISGGASRLIPSSQTSKLSRQIMDEAGLGNRDVLDIDPEEILRAQAKVIPRDIGVRNSNIPKALGVTLDDDLDCGLLVDHPMKVIESGTAPQVSMLIAVSESEVGAFRRWESDLNFVPDSFDALVDELIGWKINGTKAKEIASTYQIASNGDLAKAREQILTDWIYRLPAARLLEALSSSSSKVWALEFRGDGVNEMGHGDETTAIFDRFAQRIGKEPDPLFKEEVQSSILAFAINSEPGWSNYEPIHRVAKIMGLKSSSESDVFNSMLKLWQGVERP
jgi:para-nitrobenzyl esterase